MKMNIFEIEMIFPMTVSKEEEEKQLNIEWLEGGGWFGSRRMKVKMKE